MAAIDPELERHRRTWIGFTWFIKISILVNPIQARRCRSSSGSITAMFASPVECVASEV